MKFKVDENLPGEICAILNEEGHNTLGVIEQGLQGNDDDNLIVRCNQEKRCLITQDKDFADILRYPLGSHSGIMVLRLGNSKFFILQKIKLLLPHLSHAKISGQLWIVEPDRIRQRHPGYLGSQWIKL
jgi:predicted nuclease of predicted toxin-antitoxin system